MRLDELSLLMQDEPRRDLRILGRVYLGKWAAITGDLVIDADGYKRDRMGLSLCAA